MNETAGLLIASGIAFASAIINLAYWIVHSNGKKYIRLLTSAVMLYFSLALLVIALGIPTVYSGHELIRDWLPVLFLIPVWDLTVDWKHKTLQKRKERGGERN